VVQEKNGTPSIKVFHPKCCNEAFGAAIQVDVDVDIDTLPHSKPAWIGQLLYPKSKSDDRMPAGNSDDRLPEDVTGRGNDSRSAGTKC
jgi:hypothetical protein